MTPRDAKIAIREKRLKLAPGMPAHDESLSEFQKARLRQAFEVVDWYLRKHWNVRRIGRKLDVTHQRVTQILQLGIDRMVECGHLRERDARVPPVRHSSGERAAT